jgi:hypothetical protein
MSTTYQRTEFVALFDNLDDATRFAQDTFFIGDNPFQDHMERAICKSESVTEYGCVFSLYSGAADIEELTACVRELAERYNGVLDEDQADEVAPTDGQSSQVNEGGSEAQHETASA